ncbi:MAG: hypothetical protein NC931_02155 [Candidatus Omnitrophica bacterium]|nr:hypothetical protein [Candidatus Omnitrophota bacterium]
MAIIVIENFLTCGVYGSLKKALSAQTFTHHIFFSSAIRFFIRFLLIKMFFIFFLIFFAGLLFMVAEVTAKLPLHLTAVIVLLWLMWLTVPAFYFVLSLFAPIVLFSQDTEIFQSIKLGIISARKFLDKLVVIAFFYFLSIGLLVFFPEKAYNSISNTWMIYKSIVASFLEVGFISSLLLFYEKECNDERSI